MSVRKCPNCGAAISAGSVLANSDELHCPQCGRELEIAPSGILIASFVGLAGAGIAWRIASQSAATSEGALPWVMPVVWAVIAFGVVAPLVLMFSAQLQLRAEEPAAAPAHGTHADATSHGAHH
jgi:hypothetical protein